MIALKKINSEDVRQVVTRRVWTSGTTYDMYRSDYSRSNTAKVSGATNLYASTYYVLNSDYRVNSNQQILFQPLSIGQQVLIMLQ